jgi:trehalose 6-phosphate phosphatase
MAATLPTMVSDWALFLDIDGTLLDDAPLPDDVRVPESLRRTLGMLFDALDGAVALVSGRTLDDVDRLFAPLKLPAAGQHGAEGRRDGTPHVFVRHTAALGAILARVATFVTRHPAIRVENKGLSAQVNYRRDPAQREALGVLLADALVDTAADFQLYAGRDGFDIKPRAASKGLVMDWFMAGAPFAGRVPVFIGNDRTDEDGFAAALARGGVAIKVGREDASTVAPWRLSAPIELRAWLERSAATLEHIA